jgi:hypothetical protein
MVVAAGLVHVTVLEFLGGRGADVGDLDLEVQVLPGERMVAIEGDQIPVSCVTVTCGRRARSGRAGAYPL